MSSPEEPKLSKQIGVLAARLERGKLPTGEHAAIRRMRPESIGGGALALVRLLGDCGIDAHGEQLRRWGLLAHCLALVYGAHSPKWENSAGAVLARNGLSEGRLSQLLSADLDFLFDLLPRIARRFADVPLDWTHVAGLVLSVDSDKLDDARLRIARDYARASAQKESA